MGRGPIVFSKRRGTSRAEVQALIDASTPNLNAYLQTFDALESDLTTGGWVANELRLTRMPRILDAITTTNATIYVGASAGNIDIAVYTSTDGGTTMSRVASTGSTALSGTNAAFTTALTVNWQAGSDYWAAITLDNGGTSNIGRKTFAVATTGTGVMTRTVRTALKTASFPAPASLSSLTVPYGSAYWVMFD